MLNLLKLRTSFSKPTIILVTLLLPPLSAAAEKVWTLERTTQQAIEISPYILAAWADVDAKEGSLVQAGAWPNPTIELGGSEKLQVNKGKRGSGFTDAAISQPIPFLRLLYQSRHARAELQAANYERFYQQLLQENLAALNFHKLQLTQANLKLAKQQLNFSSSYQKGKNSKDPLIRYTSNLDKKRLNIMVEMAQQEVASEEGEYSEALANFKAFLNLPQSSSAETEPLKNVQLPASLTKLLNIQEESHAALNAAKYKKQAAIEAISIERSKRLPEPNLKFYREKDSLNNKDQFFNGVMVNFTLPIWDFNNGNVAKAKAEAAKAGYELQALERELHAKLSQSHLHLKHLIEQSEHYRTKILGPAEEVFTLTRKSFQTGTVNILSLIDANNTYFESYKRYLKLLYEASIEAANLKLMAGLSLQNNDNLSINAKDKS